MRAYVKEQTTLADLLGAVPRTTPSTRGSSTSGCRNSDPVADTESAREVGCRFTSEEWYNIWYYATEQRQARRTEEQLLREYTRFYNKFGPNSSYRIPQSYASALQNEQINIGGNNQNWEAIRRSLQRLLQQSQTSRQSRQQRSEEELENIVRILQVATRGANWVEGDILDGVRLIRSQSDWDYVSQQYPRTRISSRSLASELNRLTDNEKATLKRHFNQFNIDPGEEFEYESESSLPEALSVIPRLVEGDKNEVLTSDDAVQYVTDVLAAIKNYLNNQEPELGDKFQEFIVNENSRDGVAFARDMDAITRLSNNNRRMLDTRLQSNLRFIWQTFLSWAEEN